MNHHLHIVDVLNIVALDDAHPPVNNHVFGVKGAENRLI